VCYTFKRKRGEAVYRIYEGKSARARSALRFLMVWGGDEIIIKAFDKAAPGGLGQTVARWNENAPASISMGIDVLFVLACLSLADHSKSGGYPLTPSEDDRKAIDGAVQPMLVRCVSLYLSRACARAGVRPRPLTRPRRDLARGLT